jgi:hypothetical protein
MANSVLVTWISVVSRVAIVDSITAMTISLPPTPGQTSWPSTESTSPALPDTVLPVSTRLVAIVKISYNANTMKTPMIPPRPAERLLSCISSLRFEETSQPQ